MSERGREDAAFGPDENGPGRHDDVDALGRRLRAARGEDEPPAPPPPTSGLAVGMRMGVEFVVAVAVGTGIGWVLDRWLATAPWLTLVMFLFGVGAGFVNIMRTAKELSGQGPGDGA